MRDRSHLGIPSQAGRYNPWLKSYYPDLAPYYAPKRLYSYPMNPYTSVTLFFIAVREFFFSTVGLTLHKTISEYDVILTDGTQYLRLRRTYPREGVAAVGFELSRHEAALEFTPAQDPEAQLPFDTSGTGEFDAQLQWDPELTGIFIFIVSGMQRYRVMLRFDCAYLSCTHSDIADAKNEPNFKESNAPYIKAGA